MMAKILVKRNLTDIHAHKHSHANIATYIRGRHRVGYCFVSRACFVAGEFYGLCVVAHYCWCACVHTISHCYYFTTNGLETFCDHLCIIIHLIIIIIIHIPMGRIVMLIVFRLVFG